jgi:hypothetical protein
MSRRSAWLVSCSRCCVGTLAACALLCACGTAKSVRDSAISAELYSFLTRTGRFATDAEMITSAEQRLIAQCMHTHGYPYFLAPARPGVLDGGDAPDVVTAAETEEAQVVGRREREGYGLSELLHKARSSTREMTYLRHLAPRQAEQYMQALAGPPGSFTKGALPGGFYSYSPLGCSSKALSTLYSSANTGLKIVYLPETLALELSGKASSESEFTRATRRWSACVLRQTDRRFNDSMEAEQSFAARYRMQAMGTTLRSEERAVAVADARCSFETGLLATEDDLMHRLAVRLPSPTLHVLRSLMRQQIRATSRAIALDGSR